MVIKRDYRQNYKDHLEYCLTNISSGITLISEWIFIKTKTFKRFAPIVVLKYDLIHFKTGKDRPFVNVVTGNTTMINKKCRMFGKYSFPADKIIQFPVDKIFGYLINTKYK